MWHIEDESVIEALHTNGFTCEKSREETTPGAIHFYVDHLLSPKRESHWYTTDCPIEFNRFYLLSDGRTIRSRGTSLIWA